MGILTFALRTLFIRHDGSLTDAEAFSKTSTPSSSPLSARLPIRHVAAYPARW